LEVVVARDAAAVAQTAVARFEAAADRAIAQRGRFVVALTGGASAALLYGRLASAEVEWSRVVLLQAHDRPVPLYDDAGRAVSHRMLLAHLQLPTTREELLGALGEYRRLDLLHVGLLPDGRLDTMLVGDLVQDAREIGIIATGRRDADALTALLQSDHRGLARAWCLADREAAQGVPGLPSPALDALAREVHPPYDRRRLA
jgi:6-phosphogluconolactonase/glucosamine-6-phosphate isomerase/deaminase